jgi:hypothetical protein
MESGCAGYHRAMAATTPAKRDALPRWAGAVGLILGGTLGAAACYGLALLF